MKTKSSYQHFSRPRSRKSISFESPLHDLFITELKDIYWAEKRLVQALPNHVSAAESEELKQAFEDHLDTTELHIKRLEEVFSLLDIIADEVKCEAMEGLIKESLDLIRDPRLQGAKDAALIVAAQKIEHYEIAAYGSLRTFATVLGYQDAAELLQATLDEEVEHDERLSEIAEASVNEEARTEF